MRYAKHIMAVFVLSASVIILLVFGRCNRESVQSQTAEHVYASWDTMEFDKCVAVWLIVHFIDKDAKFVFYPESTEITKGIPFDIPGADWSRKHRKCTSQCILETIKNADTAVEEIVSIANRVELNFWQLDRWPDTQKCFYQVKEIMDKNTDLIVCFEKTNVYFDSLYAVLKSGEVKDPNN